MTKAVANDSRSLKSIAVSTAIGAATAGLGVAATTTTKAATTAGQLVRVAAGNVAKNAIIGGTGSAINHVAQSKIKGQAVTTTGVLNSFGEGAALAGVFSLAGEGVSALGRTRFVDATFNAGGMMDPSVLFGKIQGAPAALGAGIPYLGDALKGTFDAGKIMQDKLNKK